MTYLKIQYQNSPERADAVSNQLAKLITDHKDIKFVDQFHGPHGIFSILTVDDVRKVNTDNPKIQNEIDGILDEKLHSCNRCGSLSYNYLPYTYRDYHGCIGRSYECLDCRNLDNQTVQKIQNIKDELGHEFAVRYVENIYTKKATTK